MIQSANRANDIFGHGALVRVEAANIGRCILEYADGPFQVRVSVGDKIGKAVS